MLLDGVEEEEPSAKCFPTIWKPRMRMPKPTVRVLTRRKPVTGPILGTLLVDPDDPYAAYEVLVGDDEDPIEKHEWVLQLYEKIKDNELEGDG